MAKNTAAASLSYEDAKVMAKSTDAAVRQELAARTDAPPEILYFLSSDKNAGVRRIAAENCALPRQADLILAQDADQGVREGLAEKIAHLAPGLSYDDKNKLRRMTHKALETLARDQMIRVRKILSETLKDIANAPAQVVKTLAQDAQIEVCGPVLEFSPVLTDGDLIEIVQSGTAVGGIGAIARRSGLAQSVTGAIAATDDMAGIADLLSNDSAQIREEALDDLIGRAPSVELWHAPLVRRPSLPGDAAVKLAQFVADNLILQLQKRADLDAQTLKAVKSMVQYRLGDSAQKAQANSMDTEFLYTPPPVEVARQLNDAGKLDQRMIARAVHASDGSFVLAALIVRGKLPLKVLQRVFKEKSPKGVASVCWKAGLPMKISTLIQQRMACIPPADVLHPKDSGYPLKESEMKWQIDFFKDLASRRT